MAHHTGLDPKRASRWLRNGPLLVSVWLSLSGCCVSPTVKLLRHTWESYVFSNVWILMCQLYRDQNQGECVRGCFSKLGNKLEKQNFGILQSADFLCSPYLCKHNQQWSLWASPLPVNTGLSGNKGFRNILRFCTTGSSSHIVTFGPYRGYLIRELRSLTGKFLICQSPNIFTEYKKGIVL